MRIQGLLAEQWRAAGIEAGDFVLLQSGLARTYQRVYKAHGVWPSAEDVLQSVLHAIGETGTLLVPLFNYGFTRGEPFDIRSTPSRMGDLTEAARLHPHAVRTGHPIYSFAAIGALASEFEGVDNYSGHGFDSPFATLLAGDGKIAALNLTDGQCMTFYHHVEEMEGVDYRFLKEFSGEYTDGEGSNSQRTYALFVRHLDRGVVTQVDPAGELMWDRGLYRGNRWNEGHGLRTIRANEMYEFVARIIADGRAEGLLMRYESELAVESAS